MQSIENILNSRPALIFPCEYKSIPWFQPFFFLGGGITDKNNPIYICFDNTIACHFNNGFNCPGTDGVSMIAATAVKIRNVSDTCERECD